MIPIDRLCPAEERVDAAYEGSENARKVGEEGGSVLVEDDASAELLQGCRSLMRPDALPWECPLVRPVVVLDPDSLELYLGGDGDRVEVRGSFRVFVYASRLLFEMIACDDIARVFGNLDGADVGVVQACDARKRPPTKSFSAADMEGDGAGARSDGIIHRHDPFRLASILASMADTGHAALERDPEGIKLRLMTHQRQTVQWMIDQEGSEHPLGLNGRFWETRVWADSDEPYYYFPAAGELRLDRPPTVAGGLLAEEMGLGKTLEILSVIAHEKASRRKAHEGGAVEVVEDSLPSTLVVVPPALMSQWAAEISKCSNLTWTCYLGKRAAPPPGPGGEWEGGWPPVSIAASRAVAQRSWPAQWVKRLREHRFDIVLTSYNVLEAEKSRAESGFTGNSRTVLTNIIWRRIVLDECQQVSSQTSAIARTCINLRSKFRWMVSGTPLHSSVSDLNGELAFLGVWPFCLPDTSDGFWGHKITEPMRRKDRSALVLLDHLLSAVAMRHSKTQRRLLDNQPLISLPPRVWIAREIPLNPSHRLCYARLEAAAVAMLSAGQTPPHVELVEALIRAARTCLNSVFLVPLVDLDRAVRRARSRFAFDLNQQLPPLWGRAGGNAGVLAYLDEPDSDDDVNEQMDMFSNGDLLSLLRGSQNAVHSTAPDQSLFSLENVRRMTAEGALDSFLGNRHAEGDVERELRMGRQDMVDTGDARHHYERVRTYRVETVGERLEEARAKATLFRSNVARLESLIADAERGTQDEFKSHVEELEVAKRELDTVDPYVQLLEKAQGSLGSGADANVVEQSGFRGLMSFMGGDSGPKPTCPICFGQVEDAPVVMSCMHMGCGECIMQWYNAAPRLNHSARLAWSRQLTEARARMRQADRLRERLQSIADPSAHASAVEAEMQTELLRLEKDAANLCLPRVGCPLCRQPFTFSTLIHVDAQSNAHEVERRNDVVETNEVQQTLTASQEAAALSLLTFDARPDSVVCPSTGQLRVHPEIRSGEAGDLGPDAASMGVDAAFPGATLEDTDALETRLQGSIGSSGVALRDPTLPALPSAFLSHLRTLRRGDYLLASPKIAALVHDLKTHVFKAPSDTSLPQRERAVVFARSKDMVVQIQRGLQTEGLSCACIAQGSTQQEKVDAVKRFNDLDEGVLVLVVAVSTAAAGLTLTAASHVLIMEPLSSPGDLWQAIGRVHRMGQTAPRICVWQYFTKGTLEERALAALFRDAGGSENSHDLATLAADAGDNARGSTMPLRVAHMLLGVNLPPSPNDTEAAAAAP